MQINVPLLFKQHLKNKTKLIKENSIPPCWAGPLARVHMENFHLAWVGFPQNQVRSHLGGLARFSHERIIFFYEFLKEGEISPRQASPPNLASSPSYKQPLKKRELRWYSPKFSSILWPTFIKTNWIKVMTLWKKFLIFQQICHMKEGMVVI